GVVLILMMTLFSRLRRRSVRQNRILTEKKQKHLTLRGGKTAVRRRDSLARKKIDYYRRRVASGHIHESFIKRQKLSRAAICQLFSKRDEKAAGGVKATISLSNLFGAKNKTSVALR